MSHANGASRPGGERESAQGSPRGDAPRNDMAQRVLIVEDEQHLAEGLRFNLEAEGFDAEVVDTGEKALARLAEPERPVDLVVLDVMLPRKDGFTVVSELRAARNFVPVLM